MQEKLSLISILNEITKTTANKQRSLSKYIYEIEKVLKKSIGNYCSVLSDDSQVIVLDDGEGGLAFDVHIKIISRGLFSIQAFIGGKHGTKYTKTNLTLDDVLKWIKTELKDEVKELESSAKDDLDLKGYNGSEKKVKDLSEKSFTISSKELNKKPGGPKV